MSKVVQPKILQKLALRFAIGLLTLAALFYIYQWFLANAKDIDPGNFESAGYIVAIKEDGENQEAVLISPEGQIVDNPGYEAKINDSLAVWEPTGQRVFLVSDRENGDPHVFRWNPERKAVERKSLDTRGKTFLSFSVPGSKTPSKTALLLSGGTVLEYNPSDAKATQILPPAVGPSEGGDEGAGNQFSAMYQQLGQSFKKALWGVNKSGIFAVMRREDGDEVLIWQDLTKAVQPVPIVFGRSIDFDVSPTNGAAVYTVFGFEKPPKPDLMDDREYAALKKQYEHLIGAFDPTNPGVIEILKTPIGGKGAFASPAISPDGTMLAFVGGKPNEMGDFTPIGLAMTTLPNPENKAVMYDEGDVVSVTWHPSGKKLMYVRRDGGKSAIYTIDMGTHEKKNITGDKGSFSQPHYSPQTK